MRGVFTKTRGAIEPVPRGLVNSLRKGTRDTRALAWHIQIGRSPDRPAWSTVYLAAGFLAAGAFAAGAAAVLVTVSVAFWTAALASSCMSLPAAISNSSVSI